MYLHIQLLDASYESPLVAGAKFNLDRTTIGRSSGYPVFKDIRDSPDGAVHAFGLIAERFESFIVRLHTLHAQ